MRRKTDLIKVLLVEDQEVIREGIKKLIENDSEITVVGLAGDGRTALKLCKNYQPDVVLMDIVMPECDGIEATSLIKSKYPHIKILILTSFCDDGNTREALKNGADGYISKDINPEALKNAIKNIHSGLTVMDKSLFISTFKKDIFNKEELLASNSIKKIFLTEKERQIIKLIVYGKSNKEIAKEIELSEGRVRNIISEILTKFEVKDRTQLAVIAIKKEVI